MYGFSKNSTPVICFIITTCTKSPYTDLLFSHFESLTYVHQCTCLIYLTYAQKKLSNKTIAEFSLVVNNKYPSPYSCILQHCIFTIKISNNFVRIWLFTHNYNTRIIFKSFSNIVRTWTFLSPLSPSSGNICVTRPSLLSFINFCKLPN